MKVRIPKCFETTKTDGLIERLCIEVEITQKIKRMLKGYPSSSHGPYNRGDEKGLLKLLFSQRVENLVFSARGSNG